VQLVVCGQALSHCVKYTVNDILSQWNKEKSRIIILEGVFLVEVMVFEKEEMR